MSRRRKQISGHPAKRALIRDTPPMSPLERAAAATPVLRGLRGLAEWLGEGVAVTATGAPRPADVPALCAVFGIPAPAAPVRTATRVPELMSFWKVAKAADVVRVRGRRARLGEGLTGDALETWRNAFVRTVDGDDEEFIEGAEGGALVALQVLADLPARAQLDVAALDWMISKAAEAECVTFDVAAGLDLLAFFGATVRSGPRVALSPLGGHLIALLHEQAAAR
ncbi:hypothetical protein [Acrocarpospora catenulata]|uniref:hypothetical protein n=1 Tax=Acrocarpospora catenulata TaxID=2836182 RepID=UPI001BDB3932|nr:hypothetical protein [Acrocarpospora catenulata]